MTKKLPSGISPEMTVADLVDSGLAKIVPEEKPKRYWVGDVPEMDDFGYPIKMVFVDGRTKMGPWATMNPQSFVNHGLGKLGTGYGQRYVKQTDGKWLKVEG